MLRKDKVIESINNLPDNFSYEDLVDRIIVLQKIDIGIEQAKNGETYTTEEAKKKLKKWLE